MWYTTSLKCYKQWWSVAIMGGKSLENRLLQVELKDFWVSPHKSSDNLHGKSGKPLNILFATQNILATDILEESEQWPATHVLFRKIKFCFRYASGTSTAQEFSRSSNCRDVISLRCTYRSFLSSALFKLCWSCSYCFIRWSYSLLRPSDCFLTAATSVFALWKAFLRFY